METEHFRKHNGIMPGRDVSRSFSNTLIEHVIDAGLLIDRGSARGGLEGAIAPVGTC